MKKVHKPIKATTYIADLVCVKKCEICKKEKVVTECCGCVKVCVVYEIKLHYINKCDKECHEKIMGEVIFDCLPCHVKHENAKVCFENPPKLESCGCNIIITSKATLEY